MAFRQTPGLRLRPVPELGMCLAFTPSPPRLHTLNPASWLIVELCRPDGDADLEAEFMRRSVPPLAAADASQQLVAGVRQLEESGIIRRVEIGEKDE